MPDLFSIDHDPFANAFGPYEIAPSGRPRITVSPEAPVEAPVGTGAPGYAGRLNSFMTQPQQEAPPPLDTSRDRFVDELENPLVHHRFQRLMETEVGGQGPNATLA